MRIRYMKKANEWLLWALFYLLVFQNPLEQVFSPLAYVDEAVAFMGAGTYFYEVFRTGKIKMIRKNRKIVVLILAFLASGILGNFLYRYQVTSSVLIDLYTNVKFFLAIIFGYNLYMSMNPKHCRQVFLEQARFLSVCLAVLVAVDLVFEVFPDIGTRYGIRVVRLFYSHPTYLAGSATFLLAALTLFYEKRNNIYLLLAAFVMFFTLRGKAIATVVIYFLVYFYIIKQRKKIKLWQIALTGILLLVAAWDQFSYYYIELAGQSARSALTQTSFEIARDYFPIGTGFGTFASSEAATNYSPIYNMYGLSSVHGLAEGAAVFGSDTFWPIIIGQTGVIGLICYVLVLLELFKQVLDMRKVNWYAYASGVFMFGYFAVSSTSEPTFCNAVSIPLALLLGFILAMEKRNVYRNNGISHV